MVANVLKIGDFSATVEQSGSEDDQLTQWATRWNSGLTVKLVNPFYLEHSAQAIHITAVPGYAE